MQEKSSRHKKTRASCPHSKVETKIADLVETEQIRISKQGLVRVEEKLDNEYQNTAWEEDLR